MEEFTPIAVIALIIIAVVSFAKGVDRNACTKFAEQSNRETKFVDYSFWYWDCLTPTKDGKWISTYNLRDTGS